MQKQGANIFFLVAAFKGATLQPSFA
jgi:hypothetical protein